MIVWPSWLPWWARSPAVLGSPFWAAHWSLDAALSDFLWRRSNAARRRPRDLGAYPDGTGWSYGRGTARQLWREVFFPYPLCTNGCVKAGWRFPRPGAGFGARP